jgi:drug/metabolite transporter (DMT)-like permease
MAERRSRTTVVVVAVLTCVQFMYGGYHVLSKLALNDNANPLILSFIRDVVTVAILMVLASMEHIRYRRKSAISFDGEESVEDKFGVCQIFEFPYISKEHILRFALLGATGIFGNQVLFLLGLQWTTPDNAAIMQPLIPVLTALIATVLRIEQFSWIKAGGIGLAVVGALTMLGVDSIISGHQSLGGSTALIGNVSLFGNCLCFAIFILAMRPLLTIYSPLRITAWAYFFGLIFMGISVTPFIGKAEDWRINSLGWIVIFYAALISSGLAFFLIAWSNKNASPVIVTVFSAAQPLATSLLSFVVFKSEPGVRDYIGACLVVLGLFIVCWTKYHQDSSNSSSGTRESLRKVSTTISEHSALLRNSLGPSFSYDSMESGAEA